MALLAALSDNTFLSGLLLSAQGQSLHQPSSKTNASGGHITHEPDCPGVMSSCHNMQACYGLLNADDCSASAMCMPVGDIDMMYIIPDSWAGMAPS